MCGIAGFKRFGDTPITSDHVRVMLSGLWKRGSHASGLSIAHESGEVYTHKAPEPGWMFALTDETKDFLAKYLENAETVIIHARAATKGDPSNNDNNHPLDLGVTSIVHNGGIGNDDFLFGEMKLGRSGQVDSDIIRAILDKHGITPKGVDELKRMRGSAAIAAVSTAYPGKLLLARSGNPIVMASTPDMMVFASEKRFIHQAMRPFMQRFGMLWQPNTPGVAFNTMNDKSAYIIGPKGLEWHSEFVLGTNFTPITYDPHEMWRRGRKRWQMEELPANIVCHNPECSEPNIIPEALRKHDPSTLLCQKCEKPLAEVSLSV